MINIAVMIQQMNKSYKQYYVEASQYFTDKNQQFISRAEKIERFHKLFEFLCG